MLLDDTTGGGNSPHRIRASQGLENLSTISAGLLPASCMIASGRGGCRETRQGENRYQSYKRLPKHTQAQVKGDNLACSRRLVRACNIMCSTVSCLA